jgi:hypothetical protein
MSFFCVQPGIVQRPCRYGGLRDDSEAKDGSPYLEKVTVSSPTRPGGVRPETMLPKSLFSFS